MDRLSTNIVEQNEMKITQFGKFTIWQMNNWANKQFVDFTIWRLAQAWTFGFWLWQNIGLSIWASLWYPSRSRALLIYKFTRKPLKVTEKCLRLGSHPISLESNSVSVLRSCQS